MNRTAMLILACLLSPSLAQEAPPESAMLRLYLPRAVLTEKPQLSLGEIAVVHSPDASLSAMAGALAMGRSPWPGEKLVLTQATILARLASSGIPAKIVRFSGAPKVVVECKTKVIPAERIVRLAEEFLQNNPPDEEESGVLEQALPVQEMVLPEATKVDLTARRSPASGTAQVIVEVVAQQGRRELAKTRVIFKRLYERQEAVTVKDVKPGEEITPENTKIQTVKSAQPPERKFRDPYGMVATYRLRPGAQVHGENLGEQATSRPSGSGAGPGPTINVRRNENVVIRVRGPGFVITALGQALQDGQPGEYIRVRNVDTSRIVTGKIAPDGAVEPMLR